MGAALATVVGSRVGIAVREEGTLVIATRGDCDVRENIGATEGTVLGSEVKLFDEM